MPVSGLVVPVASAVSTCQCYLCVIVCLRLAVLLLGCVFICFMSTGSRLYLGRLLSENMMRLIWGISDGFLDGICEVAYHGGSEKLLFSDLCQLR